MAGHGIDDSGLETTLAEQQRLMLGMDVDQPQSDFAQRRKLNGQVVDIGPALARRRYDPTDRRAVLVIDIRPFEQAFEPVAPDIELGFDHAVPRPVPKDGDIGPRTEHEAQRTEQNRLTGPRFAGNDIQPGGKLDVQTIDQRIVFNRQTA